MLRTYQQDKSDFDNPLQSEKLMGNTGYVVTFTAQEKLVVWFNTEKVSRDTMCSFTMEHFVT